MGALITAGQELVAGTGAGQLNQYYGFADVSATTVTQAVSTILSTAFTVPAGEPYATSSYELSCAGFGVWGSTQQALTLSPYFGGVVTGVGRVIAAAAFSASAAFHWSMAMTMTCTDGVSGWQVSWLGVVAETANALNPGTASTNSVPLAGATSSAWTASVSSPIVAELQAKWASTTGAPTITTVRTNFRKVA